MKKRRIYVPTQWESFADAKRAYVEGFRASEGGAKLESNPYPKHGGDPMWKGLEWRAWNSGWRKADGSSGGTAAEVMP